MTIAQIQNLQAFIVSQLSDVIDWGKHVSADPAHKSSGDLVHILIATPFNRYKMSVRSTYIDPPPGAPVECKSLGTVTFDDFAGNKHVVGPKADLVFTEISKHVHVREYTDALAAARREMAEAPAELAGAARVKLADLAARAKKWGITAKVPEGPPQLDPVGYAPPTPAFVATMEKAVEMATQVSAVSSAMLSIVPAAGEPWIGCPIIFITNPGEAVSGMTEIPGHCVKIMSADRISIFITPDNSEVTFRDNLPRRGSAAGNGRVHQHNCWDFNPHYARERKRLDHLEEAIAKMADEGNHDRRTLDSVIARVEMLETQRDGAMNSKPAQAEKTALPLDKPQDAKGRKTG